ncbi:MAG: asparaginase domain-containing protein [Candidatus Bathyarchaeia archaeon]
MAIVESVVDPVQEKVGTHVAPDIIEELARAHGDDLNEVIDTIDQDQIATALFQSTTRHYVEMQQEPEETETLEEKQQSSSSSEDGGYICDALQKGEQEKVFATVSQLLREGGGEILMSKVGISLYKQFPTLKNWLSTRGITLTDFLWFHFDVVLQLGKTCIRELPVNTDTDTMPITTSSNFIQKSTYEVSETWNTEKVLPVCIIATGGTFGQIPKALGRSCERSENILKTVMSYNWETPGGTMGMAPRGLLFQFLNRSHFFGGKICEFEKASIDSKKFILYELSPTIDSTVATPYHWNILLSFLAKHMHSFSGFVIIHGTDTLAYTSAALSYMIRVLEKPIVITGSQCSVFNPHSDAMNNLIGACNVASSVVTNHIVLQAVMVYFHNTLTAGTSVSKVHATNFNAFCAPNSGPIGFYNGKWNFNQSLIKSINSKPSNHYLEYSLRYPYQRVHNDVSVLVVNVMPGIGHYLLKDGNVSFDQFYKNLKWNIHSGILIIAYGAGNAPLLICQAMEKARSESILVAFITGCYQGSAGSEYAVAIPQESGVCLGDMTPEAAYAKLVISSSFLKFVGGESLYQKKKLFTEAENFLHSSIKGDTMTKESLDYVVSQYRG